MHVLPSLQARSGQVGGVSPAGYAGSDGLGTAWNWLGKMILLKFPAKIQQNYVRLTIATICHVCMHAGESHLTLVHSHTAVNQMLLLNAMILLQ